MNAKLAVLGIILTASNVSAARTKQTARTPMQQTTKPLPSHRPENRTSTGSASAAPTTFSVGDRVKHTSTGETGIIQGFRSDFGGNPGDHPIVKLDAPTGSETTQNWAKSYIVKLDPNEPSVTTPLFKVGDRVKHTETGETGTIEKFSEGFFGKGSPIVKLDTPVGRHPKSGPTSRNDPKVDKSANTEKWPKSLTVKLDPETAEPEAKRQKVESEAVQTSGAAHDEPASSSGAEQEKLRQAADAAKKWGVLIMDGMSPDFIKGRVEEFLASEADNGGKLYRTTIKVEDLARYMTDTVSVHVTPLSGNAFDISLKATDPFQSLMQKIEAERGIKPSRQQLQFHEDHEPARKRELLQTYDGCNIKDFNKIVNDGKDPIKVSLVVCDESEPESEDSEEEATPWHEGGEPTEDWQAGWDYRCDAWGGPALDKPEERPHWIEDSGRPKRMYRGGNYTSNDYDEGIPCESDSDVGSDGDQSGEDASVCEGCRTDYFSGPCSC